MGGDERAAEQDAVALHRVEARQQERQGIGAGPEVDDAILPGIVGDDGADFFDQHRAGCLNGYAGQYAAGGILDDAGQRHSRTTSRDVNRTRLHHIVERHLRFDLGRDGALLGVLLQLPGGQRGLFANLRADFDNVFDFHFGVAYDYNFKQAAILREWNSGRGGANPDTENRLVKDLIYRQQRHTLTPTMEIGLWHDLAVYVSLPIVLTIEQAQAEMDGLAGLAPLYPDLVLVIVRRASPIKSVEMLEDRSVSIGPAGSGMRSMSLELLGHLGVNPKTLRKQDLYFTELLRDPELEAAIVTTGLLNTDLERLMRTRQFEILAIEELNAAGGVMGKKIEPIIEDGASDWPTFAEKSKKLLQSDKVACVFGCWTSVSRKSVLPVFEKNNGLLFYPVQYEGEELSKNIFYTAEAVNQQATPAVDYYLAQGKKIATVQGTIQTGSTTRETIYYLKNAGAKCIDVIVSYVPTVDGRQVGLYTQNRELVANKYVGEVSSINELNQNIAREIGSDSVYYNSPAVLARGIGVPENNLWFPEWVRFLDYK